MYAAPGVGLAGPQVGITIRLFVFDDGQTGPTFVANPELLDPSDTVEEEEKGISAWRRVLEQTTGALLRQSDEAEEAAKKG